VSSRRRDFAVAAVLAIFFVVVQFYTSLAALSPTPPVGYVFAGPAAAALLVATLVVTALAAFALTARLRAPDDTTLPFVLACWIGATVLSALAGIDPPLGLAVAGMMLLSGCFGLGLVRAYARPPVAAWVVGAYLWTGALAAAAGLVMLVTHRPAALWALNNGRAAGPFVTANQFAAFLIVYVCVAAGAACGTVRSGMRALALGGALLGSLALALTFSAAGWLGALAGALFFSFALGARRIAVGLLALGAVCLLIFVLSPVAGRHNPAELSSRLRTWQAGVRVAELFPLTGAGPMAYWRVYPEIRPPAGEPPGSFGALHPHDVYLSLAGELGLAGCVLVAAGWWRLAGALRSALREAPPASKRFALGICAGFVAVLVQGIFDTVGVVQIAFVWIPFGGLALGAAAHGLGEA
jgi:O-antigen ligase